MSVDLFNATVSPEIFLSASIWLFLLAAVLWFIRYFFLRRALFKLFGVSPSKYRLLATNLIWPGRSIKLRKNKLGGTPGTVFLKRTGETACLCQYKPRIFKGRAKVRERYEMLLFMGLMKEKYKLEDIQGAIRYHDHLELFNFEPAIYKNLLNMQNEYREAISEWVPPNKQPLFKRDNKF
jgi:hypothetical protein